MGDEAWECLFKVWTLFPGNREPQWVLEGGGGLIRSEPWAQQSGSWYRLGEKGELGSRETRQEAEGPCGWWH